MISFDFFSKEKIQAQHSSSEALGMFTSIINDDRFGFVRLFERKDLLDQCRETFQKFKNKKHFVHVGIGGSALGTEMLIKGLAKNDFPFTLINNIDPDEMNAQIKMLNLKECVFFFVSKSGGTAETMATLAIITSELIKLGVKESELKDYFVFATDPIKSDLLELGKTLDITCLEIPSDVGGRFSALTPVGLFPALFKGINIDELFAGAMAYKNELLKEENNPLVEGCNFLYALAKNGVNQTVLMPYSSKLKELSFWFVQLWAESLGKKSNLKGEIIHSGLTPIPAYGATDQHSQMQLFMEGPYDKCLILLEVENFENDFSLASPFSGPAFERLRSKNLSQLIKAEFYGTLKALKESGRPFIHMKVNTRDEIHLASLVLYFEALTALMGAYLQINPFDQPGVEAGKIFAYEFLEKTQ